MDLQYHPMCKIKLTILNRSKIAINTEIKIQINVFLIHGNRNYFLGNTQWSLWTTGMIVPSGL